MMIPGICDTPDRLAARIYLWLRVDCQCCTFWRAWVAGGFCGAAIGGAVMALLIYTIK